MTRILLAAALLSVAAVQAHAQAGRPGFMPDGRTEYRTGHATNTLAISDCQTVPSGEVAGQEVHGPMLKSCRVRILSRAEGGGGAMSTVLDVRTNFVWREGYWWTETRHDAWVLHRIFIERERVLINRMTSHAEPSQTYEAPRGH